MTYKRHRPIQKLSHISLETADLISLKEASEISGFSVAYLRTISQLGKLKAQKQSGTWVTSLAAIEEYKNNRYSIVKKD